MPVVYHGTDRRTAIRMAGGNLGTIDVCRGGGEFGMGYYTQSSKSNALTWALRNPRCAATACILELNIDNFAYHKLKIRILDDKSASKLRQQLRAKAITKTYRANIDVLVGPLQSDPSVEQQKFESLASQALLNSSLTRRNVL